MQVHQPLPREAVPVVRLLCDPDYVRGGIAYGSVACFKLQRWYVRCVLLPRLPVPVQLLGLLVC
jgi:hypothetical protein